ncbi:MAG: mechanosensitive ion channel [Opitutales bacterium]|nr:mechanosensitive ion channel [Opitutales bacterium]MCH8539514.1 mechanosensitive ion channel [Opitutales bacterium]
MKFITAAVQPAEDSWWYTLWSTSYDMGSFAITIPSLLTGLLLLILVWIASGLVKRLLARRFFPRIGLSHGASLATAALIGYAILFIGLLTILPIALPGFNLATLSVIAGALSFGIGFGLRNIADNFVSGLILLTERPIKIGDRIEIDNLQGMIVEIRARSTTVRTNDNVDIIVPNSQFVDNRITNLSHNDNRIRFRVAVGVHYKSDIEEVEKALLEAAENCPNALSEPPPGVRFLEFGDSSLNFELRVWSEKLQPRPNAFVSEVNKAIWHSFKKNGIEIPYPQRDLYVKQWPSPPDQPKSRS